MTKEETIPLEKIRRFDLPAYLLGTIWVLTVVLFAVLTVQVLQTFKIMQSLKDLLAQFEEVAVSPGSAAFIEQIGHRGRYLKWSVIFAAAVFPLWILGWMLVLWVLHRSRTALIQNWDKVTEKAGQLKSLNENLDAVIAERTRQLEFSNTKLLTLMQVREEAEQARKITEVNFVNMVEKNYNGMVIIDQSDKVRFVNPAAERMLGRSEAELKDGEFGYPLIADKPMEVTIVQPNKKNRCIAEMMVTETVWEGEPAYLASLHDVTERKEAEEQLRILSRAVEQSGSMILITDSRGHIEYVNRKFMEVTGYSLNEVFGKNPRLLKSGLLDRSVFENLWKTIKAGHEWRGEFINRKKNKEIYRVKSSISAIKDDEGQIINYIGIEDDVTETHKLQEQLQQSQKMEAIGKLAGGVAHDFNNQLLVISGYADFLMQEIPKEDPKYKEVEEIKKAAERSSALTRQLLAFSRRQIVSLRVFNVNDMILDLEKMFRRVLGENIDLSIKRTAARPLIKADPAQIEQVLMNLILNARDAMLKGGKLTIESDVVKFQEMEEGLQSELQAKEHVMLAVSDNGIGIPPEIKNQIFEPFFTTKEKGKGTGLGLSMCYGIVRQSKGHIRVYSEPGHGTSFKLYFPQTQEPEESWVAKKEPGSVPAGNENILIVEDEPAVRQLGVSSLNKLGYRIKEAATGNIALKFVQEGLPVDLLITDVIMPGLSGRELAEAVKKIYPEVKVLYVSGYTDDAVVHHGVLEKGIEFLQKPYSPRALAFKVREVLDKKMKSAAE